MTEDLQLIRRFVGSLVRRERTLLLWRVGLHGLLLAVVLLGVALVAAVSGWERPQAAFALVLVGGIGAWLAVVLPLVREWRHAGDLLRQAQRVEALQPELRGRLLTAVERVEGPRGHESAAMLGLVARRSAAAVKQVAIGSVHPARHVVRLGAVVVASWLLLMVASLLTPGGPGGALRWWAAGTRAEAAVAAVDFQVQDDFARVGDLVLRYTYPAYTGMDPKEVPNSTGDVTGPPGTVVEVTARTADPVQAAGVVAYDERFEAVLAEDGRQLSGRFSIGAGEGAYHLLLYRGAEPERSRDFTITPQEDLAPEVMVDAGTDQIEIPVDGGFALQWRARDDYGVARAKLMVAGELKDEALFVADGRQAEAAGVLRSSPRRLGLKPGDSVELVIAAWDNDTVSGSKVGYSRPIRLVVLGARGVEARLAAREAELIELLVPILAAHLTDPWPPADTADGMARWGEQVSRRYEPLHDAIDRLWKGMATDTQDSAVVERVTASGTELVRYTQVSFTPGSNETPADEAFAATADLHEAAVVAIEDTLIYLLGMQEARALHQVAEHARDLQNVAQAMKELLEQENPDAQEMLARLDQLERMLARLQQQAAKLGEGGLQEYINQRQSELSRLMDEVRAALAAGDMERARELMSRLQRQIDELSRGIQDEIESRVQEGSETGEQIEALKEELKALEQEQRQLQSEVQELREESDKQSSKEAQALWERIEGLAQEAVDAGTAYEQAVKGGEGESDGGFGAFLFNEKQRARSAVEDTTSLHDAVAARDLRGSRAAVRDADNGWVYVLRAAESRRSRRSQGPSPGAIDDIRDTLDEIDRLLDRLDQVSRSLDPSTRQRAQELQQQQRELEQRMEQARQQAQQISRQMQVRPEGMEEALDEADERMGQASDDLGQGQPMQAEGSQGVAAERIREARESLERAQQQMQQQQQQMQGQGQQPQDGQQSQNGQDGQNNDPFTQMEIPGREEFRTPEEYRRALLEGMEGEVPEEYRALKKRYYEELVHQ